MQFKVPQNIDMADKIIGSLTMTQFLYVLVGGMTDYILLQSVFPTQPVLFFILAVPIALLTFMLAFIKINDMPFPKFIQAALLYMASPKQRVWGKSVDLSSPVRIEAPKKVEKPRVIKGHIEKSEIEKMASVLDTSGWSAVRDAKLKEFVEGFDEAHNTMSGTTGQQPKNPKHQAPTAK